MAITIQTDVREPRQTAPSKTSRPIPPLRNGDRLTRIEFERRYDAMPHLKKAELIEGIVYIPSADFQLPEGNPPDMASPVSFRKHSAPHFDLIVWLGFYRTSTFGIRGGDNGSLRLDLDNMPQPDAFLIVLPEQGGQAKISPDDYIVGAPNSSPKSRTAASATTCTPNSRSTVAQAFENTSSGASRKKNSIGSLFEKAVLSRCRRPRPVCFKAKPSPAFGSMPPPCFKEK